MSVPIEISAYDPDWARRFAEAEAQLQSCLSRLAPVIEHIGSTAVEGLGAKPVIDVLIGLSADEGLQEVQAPLLEAGYCYYPCLEEQFPERRFFARLRGVEGAIFEGLDTLPARDAFPPLHHLHVVRYGSPFWRRHLQFRDYLRTHPLARDAYYRMKVKLANGTWESAQDYVAAKTAFIQRIEWLMNL